jgi:hypothetical protein
MRLIDVDALREKAQWMEMPDNQGINFDVRAVSVSSIDLAPTIEAEPVRYGVWKPYQTPIETRQSGWICTCCSGVAHDVSNGDTNYCPPLRRSNGW